MTASRHKVLIVCNQRVRDESLPPSDLDRLSSMADWEWLHMEGGVAFGPNDDPDAIGQLIEHVVDIDCVVVSHGSPMISAEVMDAGVAESLPLRTRRVALASRHISKRTASSPPQAPAAYSLGQRQLLQRAGRTGPWRPDLWPPPPGHQSTHPSRATSCKSSRAFRP